MREAQTFGTPIMRLADVGNRLVITYRRAFRKRIGELADGGLSTSDREQKGGGEDELFHDLSVRNITPSFYSLHNLFQKENRMAVIGLYP